MKSKTWIGALGLLMLAMTGASWAPRALDAVRGLPVQHNGRIMPFDSYAREVLWQITGEVQFKREDPVATVLSILADPDWWQEVPLLEVPFVPLREALEMNPKRRRVSYSDLLATRKLMKMLPPIVEKQGRGEKLTMLENETMDLFNRFVVFSDLIGRKIPLIPPSEPAERVWQSVHETPWAASWDTLLTAWKNQDGAGFTQAFQMFNRGLRQVNPAQDADPWRIQLEVAYNRFAPFRIAQWLYVAAALLLALALGESWRPAGFLGFGLMGTAFLFHGAGILLRVILGGRPPVSNFYETMLWIPFVAVTVGLIFERIYRVQYVAISAALLAWIMLSLSQWVPLDSGITPVVAVLRSNLWLSIHVLTIVASYGVLGLAGVLAHLYGWRYMATRGRDRRLHDLERFLYRVIQVGVVLLAAGIMLGGVWANASWGRYWGWDPKETWALITLLWFLAVLHGRFAGWLRGVRLALATLGGLFLVLMTYYGVSFYLVGLHSYAGGNAKPLPWLLTAYLVVEVSFMALIGWWSFHRKGAGS